MEEVPVCGALPGPDEDNEVDALEEAWLACEEPEESDAGRTLGVTGEAVAVDAAGAGVAGVADALVDEDGTDGPIGPDEGNDGPVGTDAAEGVETELEELERFPKRFAKKDAVLETLFFSVVGLLAGDAVGTGGVPTADELEEREEGPSSARPCNEPLLDDSAMPLAVVASEEPVALIV